MMQNKQYCRTIAKKIGLFYLAVISSKVIFYFKYFGIIFPKISQNSKFLGLKYSQHTEQDTYLHFLSYSLWIFYQ